MPNPKEAGTFELEPVYTQNTSKVGISAVSLAPKCPFLKRFGYRERSRLNWCLQKPKNCYKGKWRKK
jgi:hypothetical protein